MSVAGWHLMVDAIIFNSSLKKIGNESYISLFVKNIAEKIFDNKFVDYKKKKIFYDVNDFSLVFLLPEGNIMFKSLVKQERFSLDVFCNKKFNVEEILEYTNKMFDIKKHSTNIIQRIWTE